jgi:PHD/YefM family antitoxin component YafN of YafNO toxin-antitoxin module
VDEPAYEVSTEELISSPHLLNKALRSVALGRTVRLVTGAQEPVADIIPDSLLQELEETIEVLADSEAVQALIEAREAATRGDVVRGVDAVRSLLDGRQ